MSASEIRSSTILPFCDDYQNQQVVELCQQVPEKIPVEFKAIFNAELCQQGLFQQPASVLSTWN
jgi:hypothetical protein